jgi:hypothetical protein
MADPAGEGVDGMPDVAWSAGHVDDRVERLTVHYGQTVGPVPVHRDEPRAGNGLTAFAAGRTGHVVAGRQCLRGDRAAEEDGATEDEESHEPILRQGNAGRQSLSRRAER